ncbi:hypothetical protein B0H10DRAFT_2090451 [Mycena sp. CBHHK59/15]|nr:hypothetical protein B0H10DRAFT_2090451 [Mycena sp. CBHHK59/15]
MQWSGERGGPAARSVFPSGLLVWLYVSRVRVSSRRNVAARRFADTGVSIRVLTSVASLTRRAWYPPSRRSGLSVTSVPRISIRTTGYAPESPRMSLVLIVHIFLVLSSYAAHPRLPPPSPRTSHHVASELPPSPLLTHPSCADRPARASMPCPSWMDAPATRQLHSNLNPRHPAARP